MTETAAAVPPAERIGPDIPRTLKHDLGGGSLTRIDKQEADADQASQEEHANDPDRCD